MSALSRSYNRLSLPGGGSNYPGSRHDGFGVHGRCVTGVDAREGVWFSILGAGAKREGVIEPTQEK